MSYKSYNPGEFGEDNTDLVGGAEFLSEFSSARASEPENDSARDTSAPDAIPFIPMFGSAEQPTQTIEKFDTDNDGITDTVLITEDRDGDGLADSIAILHDSDGDGHIDSFITASDTDQDGEFDTVSLGADVDRDGSIDLVIQEGDLDGDGFADYRAVAADLNGDGRADYAGIGIDTGRDGQVDVAAATIDVDGDGIGDIVAAGVDMDGDGVISSGFGSSDVSEVYTTGPAHFAGSDDSGGDEEESGGLAALLDDACFAIGSLVHTPAGQVPIESVKVGDYVVSWCSRRGASSIAQVIRTTRHGQRPLIEITIDGLASPIRVTCGHRLLAERNWRRAGSIREGDYLTTVSGIRRVESVAQVRTRADVVNIVTAEDFSFCVQGVVSHSFSHFPALREAMHRAWSRLKRHATPLTAPQWKLLH